MGGDGDDEDDAADDDAEDDVEEADDDVDVDDTDADAADNDVEVDVFVGIFVPRFGVGGLTAAESFLVDGVVNRAFWVLAGRQSESLIAFFRRFGAFGLVQSSWRLTFFVFVCVFPKWGTKTNRYG